MKNEPLQTKVAVDLKKAETMKCKKCDNAIIIPAFILKRLSPLMSPTGEEAVIPVQVHSCGNCGELLKLNLDDVI